MNGNGTNKQKQSSDSPPLHPWWHSGSHCLAALFWLFTLRLLWAMVTNDVPFLGGLGVFLFMFTMSTLVTTLATVGQKPKAGA